MFLHKALGGWLSSCAGGLGMSLLPDMNLNSAMLRTVKKQKINEERKNVVTVEGSWRNVWAITHEVWSNSTYSMPKPENVARVKEAEKPHAVSSRTQLP